MAETVTSTESTTSTDTVPTFQEAFAAAKAEHTAAAANDATTPDPEPSTPETTATDGEADAAAGDSETSLISDAEYDALAKQHGNDPAKLRRELNKAFTQKTQKLAAERTALEPLKALAEHRELLEALQSDPEGTLKALAEQHGLKFAEPTAEVETAQQAQSAAQPAVDAIVDSFKQKLGPELEYLADSLAPAITELVKTLTQQTVTEATAPLKAAEQARLQQQAVEQTQATMSAFEQAHPDWKQHEPAMLKLAQQLQPNGLSETEYLEQLYRLVTFDTQVAEATKKKIAAVNEAAKKAEPRAQTTADTNVRRTAPKAATFHDAFEAAKRGERWDDD